MSPVWRLFLAHVDIHRLQVKLQLGGLGPFPGGLRVGAGSQGARRSVPGRLGLVCLASPRFALPRNHLGYLRQGTDRAESPRRGHVVDTS